MTLKEIEWFGLLFVTQSEKTIGSKMVLDVFVIKSQETQGNKMVWDLFGYRKTGNSRKYDGLEDVG